MLHLYAGRKGTPADLGGTMAALTAKKANGAQLGNPSNIQVARSLGRSVQTAAADQFVAGLMPANLCDPRHQTTLDAIWLALSRPPHALHPRSKIRGSGAERRHRAATRQCEYYAVSNTTHS